MRECVARGAEPDLTYRRVGKGEKPRPLAARTTGRPSRGSPCRLAVSRLCACTLSFSHPSTEKNTADSTPVSTNISTSPTIYLLLVRGANFPQFSFQCLPSHRPWGYHMIWQRIAAGQQMSRMSWSGVARETAAQARRRLAITLYHIRRHGVGSFDCHVRLRLIRGGPCGPGIWQSRHSVWINMAMARRRRHAADSGA